MFSAQYPLVQIGMTGRHRIISGTQELLAEASIRSIRMDDVAHHLGISKKTIYVHFKNKEELVLAVVADHISVYHETIKALSGKSENIFIRILDVSQFLTEIFSGLFSIQKHDLVKFYRNAWSLFQTFQDEVLIPVLGNLLYEGIADGYIRAGIKPEILARMRLAHIQHGLDHLICPASGYILSEVQHELLDHFFYGVATPESFRVLEQLTDKFKYQ